MLKCLVEPRRYKNKDDLPHDENQYLNLINDILTKGDIVSGRNGEVITGIGAVMQFSLENNTIPLLTTKRVAWKTCLKELLWFISGHTNNKILNEQGVYIWNDNASRDFLDAQGLTTLQENDLGPIYGHQWRHFNAPYTDCYADYDGKGIDQLNTIIELLKDPKTRNSRRIVMSAWNPCQIGDMALPPCHILCQFNVVGTKLSCSLYQRSGNIGLGVPFNIASYSILTHLLAYHCGLDAYEFNHFISNAHIYDDHVLPLKEQIKRIPYKFPTIAFNGLRDNISDYVVNDFAINDYNSHEKITMKMRK
jgi:thymidylate synthase